MDSRYFQANERTLLAWLRTGLGLSAFGFAVAKSGALIRLLAPEAGADHPLNAWIGVLLVLVGVATMIMGLVRYQQVLSALRDDREVPSSAAGVIVLALGIITVALALAVYQILS